MYRYVALDFFHPHTGRLLHSRTYDWSHEFFGRGFFLMAVKKWKNFLRPETGFLEAKTKVRFLK